MRHTPPMTGQPALDDCQPDWDTEDPPPGDRTPSRHHVRQQEMYDLRDQRAGISALRTATTLDVGEYL